MQRTTLTFYVKTYIYIYKNCLKNKSAFKICNILNNIIIVQNLLNSHQSRIPPQSALEMTL